ncbi:RidA family protein [Pedobacter sp. N23S346]|uniref:RidA family protein n=1 Tax=Pedobacter sp. N23S346 TaxID=3402750 RepID=UPI003AD432EB
MKKITSSYKMNKATILLCLIPFLVAHVGCGHDTGSKDRPENHQHKQRATIKEKWHWGDAQKQNEGAGYAQVVKAENTLYISGVPTADLSLKGVAEVYKTLEKCLHAYGATSKDVVKETLYTTDIETMKKYNGARKEFYKGDYPAATWVQVSRLYEADAKLEVELIAQVPGRD